VMKLEMLYLLQSHAIRSCLWKGDSFNKHWLLDILLESI
jgi:hypothetical protein